MNVMTGTIQRNLKQTQSQLRVLALAVVRREDREDWKEALKVAAAQRGLRYDANLIIHALDWAARHQ